MNMLLSITIGLLVFISNAYTWPSGAPEKVCSTLSPSHGMNQPRPASSSPFELTQSKQEYHPKDKIRVVLKAPPGISFKGLMIQAYDPSTNRPIGRFLPGKGLKTIDSCSAVTHTDRRGKRAAILIWEAPVASGKVNIRGTIVKRFSEFIEGINASLEA